MSPVVGTHGTGGRRRGSKSSQRQVTPLFQTPLHCLQTLFFAMLVEADLIFFFLPLFSLCNTTDAPRRVPTMHQESVGVSRVKLRHGGERTRKLYFM